MVCAKEFCSIGEIFVCAILNILGVLPMQYRCNIAQQGLKICIMRCANEKKYLYL